jgi:MFS family permease
MIEILIFHLHIVAALYAFTKSWQNGNKKEAFLAVMIIGLVFSIGWALTNPIAGLLMPSSWNSIYFTQDTLSLILLAIPEAFFFKIFFIKDKD